MQRAQFAACLVTAFAGSISSEAAELGLPRKLQQPPVVTL